MVARMLTELQPLMRGAKPTAAICLAMQKKIDAEETLTHMIDKEFMAQNPMGYTVGGRPKAKAFPTRASTTVEPVQTPRSTAETNWDVIPGSPPPLNDLENHLTAEEKNQLVQLMIERRQAAAASTPVPEPVNLTAAYEADMA